MVFWALLFSLFSTIVLWAMGDSNELATKKRHRDEGYETEDSGEVRFECSECRELIKQHARVCRFCGARFDTTVTPGPGTTTRPTESRMPPIAQKPAPQKRSVSEVVEKRREEETVEKPSESRWSSRSYGKGDK